MARLLPAGVAGVEGQRRVEVQEVVDSPYRVDGLQDFHQVAKVYRGVSTVRHAGRPAGQKNARCVRSDSSNICTPIDKRCVNYFSGIAAQ
jgi:hypothetical protein